MPAHASVPKAPDEVVFPRTVACPTCRAPVHAPCVSPQPAKIRRSHMSRQDRAITARTRALR
ncbi:zinc finger domain-containing protein [Streptomyces alboflavus]